MEELVQNGIERPDEMLNAKVTHVDGNEMQASIERPVEESDVADSHEPKSVKKPEYASHKRIILCADGTWTASNAGIKEVPSNVARIARAIANNGTEFHDATGALVKQIVYYSAGLGATDMKIQKALYGAFGWGIDVEICRMYDFISHNYEPGDELFFFGFSRGAFTVRCVASLVVEAGILSAVNMTKFADMREAYRNRPLHLTFDNSTWYKDNKTTLGLNGVEVKAIGVWDTVSALGFPEYWWVKMLHINKKYKFHDLDLSDKVVNAFQALALDERRYAFPPAVWRPTGNRTQAHQLQQCWFPGIHGNIGGPDDKAMPLEDIGDITFAWMVDNVSGVLTFEKPAIDEICEKHRGGSPGLNECRKKEHRSAWGCQTIASNFAFLTGWFFRLVGKQVRTPGRYGSSLGESVHPIARLCRDHASRTSYPLKSFTTTAGPAGIGYLWLDGNMVSIPEYVLEKKGMVVEKFGPLAADVSRYAFVNSLSRRLCEGEILAGLDQANGMQ